MTLPKEWQQFFENMNLRCEFFYRLSTCCSLPTYFNIQQDDFDSLRLVDMFTRNKKKGMFDNLIEVKIPRDAHMFFDEIYSGERAHPSQLAIMGIPDIIIIETPSSDWVAYIPELEIETLKKIVAMSLLKGAYHDPSTF